MSNIRKYDDNGNIIKDERLVYWTEFDTPFGKWFIASTLSGVLHIGMQGKERFFATISKFFPQEAFVECAEANEDAIRMLKEYFEGKREDFGPDPPLLDLRGATEFEIAVWEETQRIAYGTTATYGEIASKLDGASARAVGRALARNRIPIFIPCHRVIRKDGSLGGFSAGLDIKRKLLKLEGVIT